VYIHLDAERWGIEQLESAGVGDVSIAEEAVFGSDVGSLHGVTRDGQVIEVRLAPTGWFDPATDWHQTGVVEELDVDGVTVYLSEAGPPDDSDPLTFDVAHLSFECGDWVWQVVAGYGTTEELQVVVEELIGEMAC
jgi:hypothetical protein